MNKSTEWLNKAKIRYWYLCKKDHVCSLGNAILTIKTDISKERKKSLLDVEMWQNNSKHNLQEY